MKPKNMGELIGMILVSLVLLLVISWSVILTYGLYKLIVG